MVGRIPTGKYFDTNGAFVEDTPGGVRLIGPPRDRLRALIAIALGAGWAPA
jgi:hypothetical protein